MYYFKLGILLIKYGYLNHLRVDFYTYVIHNLITILCLDFAIDIQSPTDISECRFSHPLALFRRCKIDDVESRLCAHKVHKPADLFFFKRNLVFYHALEYRYSHPQPVRHDHGIDLAAVQPAVHCVTFQGIFLFRHQ